MHGGVRGPAYDAWAEFYDATRTDLAPFIDFYAGLITDGTRSLLDLGCGTGAVTVAMARAMNERGGDGARIVGIDESPEMLQVARKRTGEVEWVLGDMRSPPVKGPFDLVICSFNTLQFMLSEDELARALAAVRRVIGSQGLFAFDIYQPNPEYLETQRTDRLARSVTSDQGRRLEVRENTNYHHASRILTIDWRLQENDNDTPVLARAQFQMRQWSPAEIGRLLDEAGLVLRERYGDFDRTPFTSTSKRQIIVCVPA